MGGRGFGGSMGFGFRGSSPPWPYVGLGRGGLPRGAYFSGGVYPGWGYGYQAGMSQAMPQMSSGQELDLLRQQADMIKSQLEQIASRIAELEKAEK
ncbi:MAG: DUF5320 domain-containing protein [Dehalococcoidales bacterium]|nr:DUF5320 domain-containing protein [Dehalococcoidales bacterium]